MLIRCYSQVLYKYSPLGRSACKYIEALDEALYTGALHEALRRLYTKLCGGFARSSAQSFYIEPPQQSRRTQNRRTQNRRTQSRRAEPPYTELRAEPPYTELRAEPPQSFVQSLRRASCRASVELRVEPLYTELRAEPLYTYRHCGLRENIYKKGPNYST